MSVDSAEAVDSNGSSAPSSKNKKGTGGKAKPSFALLADAEEDVGEENGEADDASETFEELQLPPKRKKDKKKAKKEGIDEADEGHGTSGTNTSSARQDGKKPDLENAFAQLTQEETHEENGLVNHDVADDELQLPPKRKKDKKKALKGDLQSAFEQLEDSVPKAVHSNGVVAAAVNGIEGLSLRDKQMDEGNGAILKSLVEDAAEVTETATSHTEGKTKKKLSATLAPEPTGDSADEDQAEVTAGILALLCVRRLGMYQFYVGKVVRNCPRVYVTTVDWWVSHILLDSHLHFLLCREKEEKGEEIERCGLVVCCA